MLKILKQIEYYNDFRLVPGTARFLVLKSKIKKSIKFGSREIRQARKKVYNKTIQARK